MMGSHCCWCARTQQARPSRAGWHLSDEGDAEALTEEFPWVDLLPEPERRLFVLDFSRAVQTAAELGQWPVLGQTVREWKAKAAVHAESRLVSELTRPLDEDFGVVPAPEGD